MSEEPLRTLLLLRHARAEPAGGQDDADRPLTERGRADAEAAGIWLRDNEIAPTQVLCSTALRTRETWAAVAESSGFGGLVDHEPGIYQAHPQALLDLVRRADDDATALALVGHAPGVPTLAAELADGDGDPAAEQALREGYPTCTLAVLQVQGSWLDVAPGAARLAAVHTARAPQGDRD